MPEADDCPKCLISRLLPRPRVICRRDIAGSDQRRSEGRPHLGLSRGQRDRPVLGQVAHVHSHPDAGIHRRISSPFCIPAVTHRHGYRVAGLPLMVQWRLRLQLPVRIIDVEDRRACCVQAVGQHGSLSWSVAVSAAPIFSCQLPCSRGLRRLPSRRQRLGRRFRRSP